MLIPETLDLLMEKLKLWKDNMENNGLHVSMRKTKVMVCGKGLDTIKPSGKFSVVYVEKSQRRNPIFCTRCDTWVHKNNTNKPFKLV